jgi:capsular exopolysaccharide synthesis family protein
MSLKKKKNPDSLSFVTEALPHQYTEAFKTLRTNLESVDNNEIRKIVITSPENEDGRVNVEINLARSFADCGHKVLLVDADIRNPEINKILNIDCSSCGLTTALAGKTTVTECITYLDNLGIYVLPAGPVPIKPSEQIGSKKMREIIQQLDIEYDYIIFNAPPVSVVTDAALISRLTDGAILVLKHNSTTFDMALYAIESLQKASANIIGCILNSYDYKSSNKLSEYNHYKYYISEV